MQLQDAQGVVPIPAYGTNGQLITSAVYRLDEGEEAPAGGPQCMQFPYVLVSVNQMKASALDGLEPGVLPVAPLTTGTFAVAFANGKRILISRR